MDNFTFTIFNETEKTELACLNINEMWAKILEYKDFDGEKIFQNLELLVQAVLSFPLMQKRNEFSLLLVM